MIFMLVRYNYFIAPILFTSTSIFLFSCSHERLYKIDKQRLDSTLVVVQNHFLELQKIDSSQLIRAVEKYNTLKTFILSQITDTLTKDEASALYQFNESGKVLEQFQNYRVSAKKELLKSQKQLHDLIQSGTDESITPEQFMLYTQKELSASTEMTGVFRLSQLNYVKAFQDFKNALPKVEQLIKQRNKGNMPLIIKDSVSF
jgi:hypothetical protein